MKIFRELFFLIADTLFPNVCPLCEKKIYNTLFIICKDCLKSLEKVNDALLDRVIEEKFSSSGIIDHYFSNYIFTQENNVQKIIHLLKYKEKSRVGIQLGEELGKELIRLPWFELTDVIIPVPIHRVRKLERGGYNQSEMICRGIRNITGKQIGAKAIKRIKYTTTQTRLTKEEREKNLSGVFKVTQPEIVREKRIVLVDDVLTTGSTLKECIKSIREFNPKSVSVVTLAIVK